MNRRNTTIIIIASLGLAACIWTTGFLLGHDSAPVRNAWQAYINAKNDPAYKTFQDLEKIYSKLSQIRTDPADQAEAIRLYHDAIRAQSEMTDPHFNNWKALRHARDAARTRFNYIAAAICIIPLALGISLFITAPQKIKR